MRSEPSLSRVITKAMKPRLTLKGLSAQLALLGYKVAAFEGSADRSGFSFPGDDGLDDSDTIDNSVKLIMKHAARHPVYLLVAWPPKRFLRVQLSQARTIRPLDEVAHELFTKINNHEWEKE